MKKYFLVAIASAMISSCSTVEYLEVSSYLDYSIITDKGIKVSPFEAGDNYVMIGEEKVEFIPGYADRDFVEKNSEYRIKNSEDQTNKREYSSDGIYAKPASSVSGKFFTPTLQYVMERYAAIAAEKGADAIFDFKAVEIRNPQTYVLQRYEVSGVLAKEVQ